ncbi:MAG TPA: hypothetical protein VK066_05990 [Chloroflexota bacterium]|nr:hypothetical protein [Chloroflexota bacterium]
MSDPLDLEPIKARCAAATPGWWKASGDTLVANAGNGPWLSLTGWPRADRHFVEHARADVPALVAEVEELRGRLARLGAAHAAAGAHIDALAAANAALAAENDRFRRALAVIRDYVLLPWADFEARHPGLLRSAESSPRFDISAYAVAALGDSAPEEGATRALPAPADGPPLLAAPPIEA